MAKYKEKLSFHFALPKYLNNSLEHDLSEEFSKSFYKELGLNCTSGCWSEINLDSSDILLFIEKVKYYKKYRNADFFGHCTLTQTLNTYNLNDDQWFIINTKNCISDFYNEKLVNNICIPTLKADKINFTSHVAYGNNYNIYVSEKFKKICENNNLSGIKFLWLTDKSKFKAKQWFVPIPMNPIGRGIDHEWFDTGKLRGSDCFQPIEDQFRTGVNNFSNAQIKKNAEMTDIQKAVLELFNPKSLTIYGTLKYLQIYLPKTDFAFNWCDTDFIREHGSYKRRGLCINLKTKNILIKEGLISESEIEQIEIIKDIPGNSEIPDNIKSIYPTSIYTIEEYTKISQIINKDYINFIKTEKPVKLITINDTIELFKNKKQLFPDDFRKGLKLDVLPEQLILMPEEYKKIIKISNGAYLDTECQLFDIDSIIKETAEVENHQKKLNDTFCENWIVLGKSINGDRYIIDVKKNSENNLKVLRISHESNEIEYKWNNICEFIYEILNGFYKE